MIKVNMTSKQVSTFL